MVSSSLLLLLLKAPAAWSSVLQVAPGRTKEVDERSWGRCGQGTVFDSAAKSCICNSRRSCGEIKSSFFESRRLEEETGNISSSNQDTTKEATESSSGTSNMDSEASDQRSTSPADDVVTMFALFDTDTYFWGEELVKYTVAMINNKTDGYLDDIPIVLEAPVANTACNDANATRAYWKLRNDYNKGTPPHAILGCRCSGASLAVARIAGLEGVPQVSMSAESEIFVPSETPYFSRLSSPHSPGAAATALRALNWTRVSIISTDTQFTRDYSTRFHREWEGSSAGGGVVVKSATISLNKNGGLVNEESAIRALESIPTHEKGFSSRVILLNAHFEDAGEILRIAYEMNFQPDTIWVWSNINGTESHVPDISGMPHHPGYLGILPYRSNNEAKRDFLAHFNQARSTDGLEPWKDLPHWAADYMVDSIAVLAQALSTVPQEERRNGTLVTSTLRDVSYLRGVSGTVSFTPEGHRDNPDYSLWHMRTKGHSFVEIATIQDGKFNWIGDTASKTDSSASRSGTELCFPEFGCMVKSTPLDTDPEPLPRNMKILIGCLAALAVVATVVCFLCLRSQRNADRISKAYTNLEAARQELQDEIDQRVKNQITPKHWDDASTDILVPVSIETDEYWMVADNLKSTITNGHISKLWRIQNKHLYAYYSFHTTRFVDADIAPNEKNVWHGTSALDPRYIYRDSLDGWMMQYAETGMWGKGTYFAEKAEYSDDGYHFQPKGYPLEDREKTDHSDECELLLAKLLVGDEKEELVASRDTQAFTMPPTNPATGRRYNTVVGETGGSKVYIVYENGRAYPEYLVRYYRGRIDDRRTLYASRDEMLRLRRQAEPSEQAPNNQNASNDDDASTEISFVPPQLPVGYRYGTDDQQEEEENYTWVFQKDDESWQPYAMEHQVALEAAYQARDPATASATVQIHGPEWTYTVNVATMRQRNLQHESHTERAVDRVPSSSIVAASMDNEETTV